MNRDKILLYGAVILYAASLFLPGFIYKPSLNENDKYNICNSYLSSLSSTYVCRLNEMSSKVPIECYLPWEYPRLGAVPFPGEIGSNVDEITKWCEGYDTPLPVDPSYGYIILAMGWLGFFAGGMMAWYANPIFWAALLNGWRWRNWETSRNLSLLAFVLGLQSFLFKENPQDEGGVNILYVDHLGIGFYAWMTSFIFLALYSHMQMKSQDTTPKD